jgi:hypothetical protein
VVGELAAWPSSWPSWPRSSWPPRDRARRPGRGQRAGRRPPGPRLAVVLAVPAALGGLAAWPWAPGSRDEAEPGRPAHELAAAVDRARAVLAYELAAAVDRARAVLADELPAAVDRARPPALDELPAR